MSGAYSSGFGDSRKHPFALIGVTLFLSLALEFLPWPGWALRVKPLFPDLALVYWVIYRPQIVNYAVAIVMGVMLDLAGQLPLGFTALSYCIVVFLSNGMRGRFSLLGPFGQATHVLFVLCCGQAVLVMLKLTESGDWSDFSAQWNWRLFAPSASAAALWLFLPLLMRRLSAVLRGRQENQDG